MSKIARSYRGVYAAQIRRWTAQPRHIIELQSWPVLGKMGPPSRHPDGKALCGVRASRITESGDQGKPENATCARCTAAWRKLGGQP